ncbi:MAG: Na+/H+ antiporter subunit E [Candidatus Marinimicrobia bacterium]|nr:Na+/H+ antiporter subunit E [Candidatus Neomarinimicrobiota bacterium]
MKRFKHTLLLFLFLMLLWVLLTPNDIQEIWAGLAVSALVVLFTLKMEPVLGDVKLTPKSLVYSVIYLFVFLKELIVSNLDVARRVVDPKLPIKPGIVKVKTKLNSRIGRTILANSITLTPGTLTVDIKDEYLYIHWIEIKYEDLEGATKDIVQKFEKYLEVIFG